MPPAVARQRRRALEEMPLERFGFGLHVLADGYKADPIRLEDAELLQHTLRAMVAELGVVTDSEPDVFEVGGATPLDAGLTGVLRVADSHVVIHCFSRQAFVHVNIFSARELETEGALKRVVDAFGVRRFETRLMTRGKQLPVNPLEVRLVLRGERDYLETRIA
jgi:S-adenosylmethionine decarboxylase